MNNKTFTSVELRCFGCGAVIQNANPALTGFLPRQVSKNENPLCQRCYRLQHYGEDIPNPTFSAEYRKVMDEARRTKSLIVYVVDLFAFESSLIFSAFEYLKACPLIVVANKRDVLPKAVDDNKFIHFVNEKLKEYDITPIKTIISSAYKNINIDDIISEVNKLRNGKNVYVVGSASVGKSSIINSFLRIYKNETKTFISTSPYPGTTLDVIKVPLDDKTYFYDTPGILIENSIFAHVDKNAMKYIFPRREVNPRTFQINADQSIFIGGLARFDFTEGKKGSFTFFASNEVDLHRTKIDKADQTFVSLINSKSIKPISNTVKGNEDLDKVEFILPETPVDITISGLCWIKCIAPNAKVTVHVPHGVIVNMRGCKI